MGGRIVMWTCSAALAFGVMAPNAHAYKLQEPRCTGNSELIRIESKTCPATRERPAFVVQRACCQKANDQIRCQHMPHCPRRSPS